LNDSSSKDFSPENLCVKCGLCCNGVIFADVKLQAHDSAQRLRELGLALTNSGRHELKFAQPCVAFENCRCRIYGERPRYCREFECILLKNVISGRVNYEAGLRMIQNAKEKVETVLGLLRALGDRDEQVALAARFRKMTKKFESEPLEEETADLYGRLTLAVHDLNCLLSEAFYR
jgi:Fe-S-cluster containining protein